MKASVPIRAEAIIPVAQSDVSGIPSIALVIPDFEGFATLRFFSNTSQSEIGCFQAVMRNGASLSHPKAVAPVLGILTVVALLASFSTAIYGVSIAAIRTHYAHSLSVLVIFETFQSFFFSGALSLNWPSVCVAWWSNFAWTAGMIYSPAMTSSIDSFLGTNQGNSSQVGGAGSVPLNNNGGLQIYGRNTRGMATKAFNAVMRGQRFASRLYARDTASVDDTIGPGYSWYGGPVTQGLPIPGVWSNFTGELSVLGIPASNAFMTGFLWFLIALVIAIGATVLFKWTLEACSAIRWIQHDRLALFRHYWLGFVQVIILRTMMIAFFMMMTLTLYQFSIAGAAAGVIAVATIVFVIFFVGLLGIAAYACFYRLRFGHYESAPDRILISHRKIWNVVPGLSFTRQSRLKDENQSVRAHSASFPVVWIKYVDHNPERQSIHEDQQFIKRFGWLSARYRRTRWWYFAVWFIYQFIRACFVGGAKESPEIQVFGLFVVEIIAMILIISMNPYEGSRNTALAVYLLSISKVVTAGLSIAFLPQFNMPRIPATVIGFVIVITQGLVAIALLILVLLGAISSYMSLTRNREEFRPHKLENIRLKYFTHLETKAPDISPAPSPKPEEPREPKEPYFSVNAVRRAPKIEDEDEDMIADMTNPITSQFNPSGRQSRAGSMRSTVSGVGGVPYGARVHRISWSSRDFAAWQQEGLGDSPSRAPSRHNSGGWVSHAAHTSISMAPLVRPPVSLSGSRPTTPSREQQIQHASQRFGNVR